MVLRFFSRICSIFRGTLVQKEGGCPSPLNSSINFTWFFMYFNSLTQMKIFEENYPENVYDGLVLSKIISLRCIDCSSPIKRLHHRFFSENVLKNMFWTPPRRYPPHALCKMAPFKIFHCHSSSNKVAGLQSIVRNLDENEVFHKNR